MLKIVDRTKRCILRFIILPLLQRARASLQTCELRIASNNRRKIKEQRNSGDLLKSGMAQGLSESYTRRHRKRASRRKNALEIHLVTVLLTSIVTPTIQINFCELIPHIAFMLDTNSGSNIIKENFYLKTVLSIITIF